MNTIKEKGVLNLVKEGVLPFPQNWEFIQCLTSDLTLQDIVNNLEMINKLFQPIPGCLEKMKPIYEAQKKWIEDYKDWQKQKEKAEEYAKENITGYILLPFIAGALFFVALLSWGAGRANWWHIAMWGLVPIAIVVLIAGLQSRRHQKIMQHQKELLKQMEEYEEHEANILAPIYVKTLSKALSLYSQLSSINDVLNKMFVVLKDEKCGEGQKIVQLETLLSLFKQAAIQEEQLAESKKATQYAQAQAQRAAEQALYAKMQMEQAALQAAEQTRAINALREQLKEKTSR